MPQEQKKSSSPNKRSMLQRIFGAEEMTPSVQEGLRIARQENPDLAPVKPYGLFSRLLAPDSVGYTNELGRTIYIDPSKPEMGNPQDVADTLLHEQTHIRQGEGKGFLEKFFNRLKPAGPYEKRPWEIEAFQAEKARRAKTGRPQPIYNSAMGGQYWPNDIQLRAERK